MPPRILKICFESFFQNTYNLIGQDAKGVYYNQFEDNSYISLTNFDEDENPLTATSETISISSNNLKAWEETPLSAELGSGKMIFVPAQIRKVAYLRQRK